MDLSSRVLTFILLTATLLPLAARAQPARVGYQGELEKDGQLYSGTAQMKFAVVSEGQTLWSNDGTSAAGSEPTAAVAVSTDAGLFSVQLGGAPMVGIPAQDFEGVTDAVLRVWVDSGEGFEQLSDQPISSGAFSLNSDRTNQVGPISPGHLPMWDGTRLSEAGVRYVSDGGGYANLILNYNGSLFAGGNGVNGIGYNVNWQFNGGATRYYKFAPDSSMWLEFPTTYAAFKADTGTSPGPMGALELMRITNDGRVGIGTTSPSSILHLSSGTDGVPAALTMQDGSNRTLVLRSPGFTEAQVGTSTGHMMQLITFDQPRVTIDTSGNVGIGTTSPTAKLDVAGNVQCVSLIETSSARFKTDVRPIADALAKVLSLQGVAFRWNDELGGDEDLGLIGEEVAKVLPELVRCDPDDDQVAGLKYNHLSAVLVEAVKEQNGRIEALRATVAEKDGCIAGQQREIDELRARLDRLESMMADRAVGSLGR